MTSSGGVPLFFITGFLGSGKTTLLNNLLDEAGAQGRKIGVIINEWGRVSIDAGLLPGKDIEITELNDGQVFCSCLSGNFIEALALFAQRPLDAVIVETSGMANPLPLKQLLADLQKLTGLHYAYQGMSALVDPENFLELVEDLNAVEEQIISSQRIIINKVDLADQETLGRIRQKVTALNPAAEIVETSYGRVKGLMETPIAGGSGNPFLVRKARPLPARPNHYLVTTTESVAPENAAAFVRAILPGAFRVKGFVRDAQRGWFYIDGVNERVESRPIEASGAESKIVIIPKAGKELEQHIASAWAEQCKVSFSLS